MFFDSQIWMNRLMDDRHFINITKLWKKKTGPESQVPTGVLFFPIFFPAIFHCVFFSYKFIFTNENYIFHLKKRTDTGTDFGLGSSVFFFQICGIVTEVAIIHKVI
jgi:hypothetical protein